MTKNSVPQRPTGHELRALLNSITGNPDAPVTDEALLRFYEAVTGSGSLELTPTPEASPDSSSREMEVGPGHAEQVKKLRGKRWNAPGRYSPQSQDLALQVAEKAARNLKRSGVRLTYNLDTGFYTVVRPKRKS
jgi:hypothetical protein